MRGGPGPRTTAWCGCCSAHSVWTFPAQAEAKVRIAVFANSPSAFETAAKEMRQSSAEPLQNPSSPAPAPAQPGAT
jgi:hypothetical protein